MKKNEKMRGEFVVAVRRVVSAVCGSPRVPDMPTADPRRWQPRHVSHCFTVSPFQLFNRLVVYLLVTLSTICVKITSPSALRHLNESSRTGTTSVFIDAFIIHTITFHPVLSFLIGLSHLSTYTQRGHPPELCLSLSTNRHWRLFVILLLLALPCLNSLTRCVITYPIWPNNPRQRGLEVFMNLSQPCFSPQAAAILASSGFFLPTDFISGDMNLHEVIEFPTHLGHPGSKIWSLSTLMAISLRMSRAHSRPYPHTSRNNHVR